MMEISQYNPALLRHHAPCLFKESPGYHSDSDVQFDTEKGVEPEKGSCIICKFCQNIVSSKQDILEINGKHVHVFVNPAGITYRIGCFISARGCLTMGEPTHEYSWFPGYRWSYALCSKCLNHLGWHYISNSSGFYGLILDNIRENN